MIADTTALQRQHRRLERLKAEGIHRSTVFVHQQCQSVLESLRPLLLNPDQAPLIERVLTEVQELTPPTNVAQVVQLSPFRYPGGKTWLVPELRRWLSTIGSVNHFIEPFAGGASCGLMVAHEKRAKSVILGELDQAVAAVWQVLFEAPADDLAWVSRQILTFKVEESAVRRILANEPRTLRERAWRTIIQNRMQRGGILAPGAGLVKTGENGRGLSSRWYPETLVKRFGLIQGFRDRVSVFAGDAFELIAQHAKGKANCFLIDPPYTAGGKRAGSRLYRHHALDHHRLFQTMANVRGNVMMTYDDSPEVRELAKQFEFRVTQVPMKSTHHEVHKELVLIRPAS